MNMSTILTYLAAILAAAGLAGAPETITSLATLIGVDVGVVTLPEPIVGLVAAVAGVALYLWRRWRPSEPSAPTAKCSAWACVIAVALSMSACGAIAVEREGIRGTSEAEGSVSWTCGERYGEPGDCAVEGSGSAEMAVEAGFDVCIKIKNFRWCGPVDSWTEGRASNGSAASVACLSGPIFGEHCNRLGGKLP